jgi:hypothetical protein
MASVVSTNPSLSNYDDIQHHCRIRHYQQTTKIFNTTVAAIVIVVVIVIVTILGIINTLSMKGLVCL